MTVDIDSSAGVAVAVAAWELAGICGHSGSSTSDGKLSALGVPLSRLRVQSDGLEAEKVVASRNTARDGRSPSVVVVDHLAASPVTGGNSTADQARLINLEPAQVFRIGAIAASVAVGHVSQHWAVWMWPRVVPICSNGSACSCSSSKLLPRGEGSSGVVASDGRSCGILDGVVCIPFTLDGYLASRGVVRFEAPVPLTTPRI